MIARDRARPAIFRGKSSAVLSEFCIQQYRILAITHARSITPLKHSAIDTKLGKRDRRDTRKF